MTMNSSPPHLPTVSVSLVFEESILETSTRISSPILCPKVSFMFLNLSISINMTEKFVLYLVYRDISFFTISSISLLL